MQMHELAHRLVPDLLEELYKRYAILSAIRRIEPIGRRGLAQVLNRTERTIRSDTDFLVQHGLLTVTGKGLILTGEAHQLIDEVAPLIHEWLGMKALEEKLQKTLALKEVYVLPGNSDEQPWVKQEMGKKAAEVLTKQVEEGSRIAVAGGSSMAAVADALGVNPKLKSVLFLPARGSFGENLTLQANAICSRMAEKTGGKYRLLHVPDQLSDASYETLLADPHINEIVQEVRQSSMIMHGIGEAITMAKRRKSSPEIMQLLEEKAAIAEAFGYYFNQAGQIVHKINSIGLKLEDISQDKKIIAVAGGAAKAEPIKAFCKSGLQRILVTDEAAAKAILQG